MVVETSTISPSIPILEYSFMDQPLEFEPEANMFEAHMIDLHTSRFLCLIDCASTHTILCHKEFFHHIEDQAPFDIKTIVGSCIGQGRGPASIQLPSGVFLEIHDAIYAYLTKKSSCICRYVTQWIPSHDMGTRWERDNASCQAHGKYYPSN